MPETSVAPPPVRLLSAPPCDPPFDDELSADLWWSATAGQPLLDLPAPTDQCLFDGHGRNPRHTSHLGDPGYDNPSHSGHSSNPSHASHGGRASPAAPRLQSTTPGAPLELSAGQQPAAEPPTPVRPITGASLTTSTAEPGRPQRTLPAAPPTTTAAVRFINTCLEIFNGYRPVAHFRTLASPLEAGRVVAEMTQALRRLRRSTSTSRHRDRLIKLRRMRTCQPRPDVAEVAVVIGVGGNAVRGQSAWALAYRLERQHGRWLCTAARML